ncbi:MAG: pyruvate dehydrogenase (acetyl-transferring), homodimeric type [Magnetococcales bacterium]|nr:pyruvate dehydrogenase (acetyl-transferring), homodimeric type [Magnetococcales bacterium]
MNPSKNTNQESEQELENREWRESLEHVFRASGGDRVVELLHVLQDQAEALGVKVPFSANTSYTNTIAAEEQPIFPGDREMERRLESLIRWNAMAMVVRANNEESGIGGHISTYASAATLFEVGFNHFFRGPDHPCGGDMVFVQAHAAPGIYARAFLEGRLEELDLVNYRRELREGGGLPSYPHPRLMPHFWQVPTASMGLGPLLAIYLARFRRYLEDRGLKERNDAKIWSFIGDGETDEPEALGAISLAAREGLDNLVFVINCNLQRLDGPVRGNGHIIQELEANFRGVGWNVIKVLWGSDWDPLFERDHEGLLRQRLQELVDGEYQKLAIETGDYVRRKVFGGDPRLERLAGRLSDDQLRKLSRGGHDREKVYAAFHAAMHHRGRPTVILAKTIKGYGMGPAGEAMNITHTQKQLSVADVQRFRARFDLPFSDEEAARMPFFKPGEEAEEMRYIKRMRENLGGSLPLRRTPAAPMPMPDPGVFREFYSGTGEHAMSTTMVFVRLLGKLLREKGVGERIVPIVSDEARTFGMEALFRQCGIYAHAGQLYEPVDSKTLLYYKEARDGQILEEGITEAGAMGSFIAAGTSFANFGVTMAPFFIYYSMFGFQRVGDLIWAGTDMGARGFLIGATAGRTTLAGEGLQHQDGASHLLALPVPTVRAYDPAFAYELEVIIEEGMQRMFVERADCFYYITVMNENYCHPPMPEGAREGILRGMYLLRSSDLPDQERRVHLFGSGAILNEALAAQELLQPYGVAALVWSVTSYKELRREALDLERYNRLNPHEMPRIPYITRCLQGMPGPVVAASDYVTALPDSVARWIPHGSHSWTSLGTDGFGRSDGRASLREFFEVDRYSIALAALNSLQKLGKMKQEVVVEAIKNFKINPDKPNPVTVPGDYWRDRRKKTEG